MLIGVSYVIVLVSLGVLGWLAHQRNLEAARREAEEMFQRGKRSTDPKQAVKWYRKAADKGDASAMVVLGYRYYNGEGVAKDPTEAVRWWRRAADKGNASAMFNLGWRYANGQGVAKDPKEAVRWWRRAADKGHSGAKMTLERLGR